MRPTRSASGTSPPRTRPTWRPHAPPGPSGRGFDRWYGFHGGETHQFVPALCHDNHPSGHPGSAEDGYHLSDDLADHAIEFVGDLRAVDADQPFFLYFCTGACHSPHQAPAQWIERYRGHFDQGWDQWRRETHARQLAMGIIPEGTLLPPRPPWVPAWDDLDDQERALGERFMECFAAYLSLHGRTDRAPVGIPRRPGDVDDTVVVVVSDNGASSEGGRAGTINEGRLTNFDAASTREMYRRIDEIGGPLSHNNYPWGWTMAGNTPLRRWKREVHEGGVADPCIVSWPVGSPERGRHPSAVRPRDRRAANGAGARRRRARPTTSTALPSPTSTAPASPTFSTPAGRTEPAGTPRSTSRCSAAGRSTTTAGRP